MQAKATVRDLRKHGWRGEVVQRQSRIAVIEPHVFVRLSLMRVVSLFRDRCGSLNWTVVGTRDLVLCFDLP